MVFLVFLVAMSLVSQGYSQNAKGSRPAYVYDNANVISSEYESLLDNYLRKVDEATSMA